MEISPWIQMLQYLSFALLGVEYTAGGQVKWRVLKEQFSTLQTKAILKWKSQMWNKIKNWWFTLIKEEYELTIFFPGKTEILGDGTRITSGNPKTYRAGVIKKATPNHFIFVDLDGRKHEIKVVDPVGYDLKKIY